MAKKRVTRKKVDDSTINNVFRDIYDKIDDLQPQSDGYISKKAPSVGDTTIVTTDANVTSMAAYTEDGWMIDINSNFQRVSSRHGFIASEGVHGKSRTPVHGEAVRYDRNYNLPINNHKKERVLLKNVGGILNVRNANDSADADIRCASIKDSNGKKVIDIASASSAVNFVKNTNSATTNNPVIAPDGDDTNIGLTLTSKGTGDVALQSSATSSEIQFLQSTGALRAQISPSNTPAFNMYGSAADQVVLDVTTAGLTRLWNFTDGTTAHMQISAADWLYLASGNGIYLMGGGTGQAGGSATFDMGSNYATLKAGGGSTLVHTAAATSTGLEIDSNLSGDDAQTGVGLKVDFDRTVPDSGTEAHLDSGISVNVTSASLGTSFLYGLYVDVNGAASGTSTAYGLYVDANGADANFGMLINTTGTHIKMAAQADPITDYGTIAVADTGDMTISTTGDGTTDSDLTLDVDGDIELNADGGNINFKDALSPLFAISQGNWYSYYDASNNARLTVSSAGVTTLSSTGSTATDADINLDAGGDIILDSGTGVFIAKNAGTQFSVANSAYAGMILGYTTVGIDATAGSYSITGTMTTVDDALKVKFVAPPSGVVEISIQVYFDAARRFPVLGLSDQDTGDTYRAISFPNATDVTNEHLVAGPPTTLGDTILNNSWVVIGLTPGTAYEWWLGAKSTIGLGSVLRWGGVATNQYPPFIMKAVALPAAAVDFAVYG